MELHDARLLGQMKWESSKGQIPKNDDITAHVAFGIDGLDKVLYRYIAQYVWDASKSVMIALFANPSTATHLVFDPTIDGMVKRARTWQYGGLIVVNAFAYRATKPKDMYAAHKAGTDIVGPANNAVLRSMFARVNLSGDICIVGWGKIGAYADRAQQIMAMAQEERCTLHALRVNGDGSPGHPLYIPRDILPEPFFTPTPKIRLRSRP